MTKEEEDLLFLANQFRHATVEINRLQAHLNEQTALRMFVAWKMHELGWSYRRIAEVVGLSTARIYQMVGVHEGRMEGE